jgi:hypothetical protein
MSKPNELKCIKQYIPLCDVYIWYEKILNNSLVLVVLLIPLNKLQVLGHIPKWLSRLLRTFKCILNSQKYI